jgi:hypothetical protein
MFRSKSTPLDAARWAKRGVPNKQGIIIDVGHTKLGIIYGKVLLHRNNKENLSFWRARCYNARLRRGTL